MMYISPPLQILIAAFISGVSWTLSVFGVIYTSLLLVMFIPLAVLSTIFMFVTTSELQKERIKDGHYGR